MISAVIASRLRVHADALAAMLSQGHRVRVIGTASQRDELLSQVRDLRPDVVLIDATVPEAVGTAAEIRRGTQAVKVVAITLGETEAEVVQLAEAGVSGYVLPDGSIDDLLIAVESAVRGELYCPPRVAYSLLRRVGALAARGDEDEEHSPLAALTTREREILQLVDQGMSNKGIARHLGIEVATAKNHVHNILRKLHVHRRINASIWYRRGGFHLKLEA